MKILHNKRSKCWNFSHISKCWSFNYVCSRQIIRSTLLWYLGEDCPEGFEQLEVVYENSWSDWEDAAAVWVFDFFGELFLLEHAESSMALDNRFYFDPQPITLEQLEELKMEWGKFNF